MYVHSHYVTKDFIFNVAQSTSVIVFLMYEQHAYIRYVIWTHISLIYKKRKILHVLYSELGPAVHVHV